MNCSQITAIKNKIAKEITLTEEKIKKYEEISVPQAPDNAIGRVSRIDAINNKSVTESALRESKRKLALLQMIRAKTDEKEFGICQKCAQNIPFRRLILMPHSQFCIHCAK